MLLMQMEISVFETGVAPRFRLYWSDRKNQKLMPTDDGTILLETTRPDGKKQQFEFALKNDYPPSITDNSTEVAMGRASGYTCFPAPDL
jgi:hypothetical protein